MQYETYRVQVLFPKHVYLSGPIRSPLIEKKHGASGGCSHVWSTTFLNISNNWRRFEKKCPFTDAFGALDSRLVTRNPGKIFCL